MRLRIIKANQDHGPDGPRFGTSSPPRLYSWLSNKRKLTVSVFGRVFDIERTAMGLPPEQRRRLRQSAARPVIDALAAYLDASLTQISVRSELAKAIRYARSRWTARKSASVAGLAAIAAVPLGVSPLLAPWRSRTPSRVARRSR